MRAGIRFLKIILLISYPLFVHLAIYFHFSVVNYLAVLLYLQPIIISFLLLIFFGKTLLPNQEPLITTIARVVYQENQPEVQVYTRRVTKVWCGFFLAMLVEAVLLGLFADMETWSLFCNILNYVFIAVLFVIEYVYRKIKFKNTDSFRVSIGRLAKTNFKKLVKQEKKLSVPLFSHNSLEDVFAFHRGESIKCAKFLKQINAVASRLPNQKYIINLCEDRYYFMVLFAASLMKEKITLLPHNTSTHVIAQLQKEFEDNAVLKNSDIELILQNPNFYYHDTYIEIPVIDTNQLAAILYTSGSTGKPAAWKKYWGDLVNHCMSTAESLFLNKHEKIRVLATVAPQHMYGFEHSVILPMQMGYVACASKPFFVEDIRSVLQASEYETVMFSTPLQLKQCAETDLIFPSVKMLVSATARLSTSLAVQLEKKFSTNLHEIYGCTEAGCVAIRRTAITDMWSMNGSYRLHYKKQDCYLVLSNGKKIKLYDEIEKINESHFLLHGRLQENINIAGNRMSLSDLNLKLNSISGIKDGVFHLLTTENTEARLIAFVVTRLTDEEIRKTLKTMINPIFLPRTIIRVEKLPRNEIGKLDLEAMRKLVSISLSGFVVKKTHASLPGHFPSNSVVPGVVILQHVTAEFKKLHNNKLIEKILNVKFRNQLLPDVKGRVVFTQTKNENFQFQVKQRNEVIANGSLIVGDLS